MKSIFAALLAVLGLMMIGCSEDIPSTDQVEPALRTYLIAEKAKSCNGSVTVDRVSINKVGQFDSKLDGFPVYATFGVQCSEGTVWRNDDTSTTSTTIVVRKKISGEYECFTPEIFRQRQNDMQKATNNVPDDMMKGDVPKPVGVPGR